MNGHVFFILCMVAHESSVKGYVCHGDCGSHGKCVNYVCQCSDGYHGDRCELDACSSSPCHNGGHCYLSGTHFGCNCNQGYTGDNCQVSTTCPLDCGKHGTCQHNHHSKPFCHCQHGFWGDHCEKVDGCLHQNCHHRGDCTPTDHRPFYACNCSSGYFGDICAQDHCGSTPCQNNGQCEPLTHGAFYRCHCKTGFSGTNCEVYPTTQTTKVSTTDVPKTSHITHSTTQTPKVSTTEIFQTIHRCVKYTTVLDIAEKVIETNPVAAMCPSGNHSSHEAFVLNNCGLSNPSSWTPGYNVINLCDDPLQCYPNVYTDSGI